MNFFPICRWGCKHEAAARQHYENQHRLTLSDVLVENAGFTISATHSFIGFVFCSCCGGGVLEVKCPFCAKDMTVTDAVNSLTGWTKMAT